MKIISQNNFLKLLAAQGVSYLYKDLNTITTPCSRQDTLSISNMGRMYSNKGKTDREVKSITPDSDMYLRIDGKSRVRMQSADYLQEKIDTLTSALKSDPTFMNKSNREFINHPMARELVSNMIMADEKLQDEIAQKLWADIDSANSAVSSNPQIYGSAKPIPSSWQEYDIPAMLTSGNKDAVNQVLFAFDGVMVKRARTDGLSETERFLSKRYERIDFTSHATFQDKMESIGEKISRKFEENNLKQDKDTIFSFSLNAETFTFSVSGGTEEENRMIEDIVNTTNILGHSYDENNLGKIIHNLLYHRRDDGAYNPWSVKLSSTDSTILAQETKKYGIAGASKEYIAKMEQLPAAYDRYRLDQRMKKSYGFGIDDIAYQNGHIIGKTDEITAKIKENESDFMKEKGFAYLRVLREYRGTPFFDAPLFTYSNGSFNAMYHE